MVGYAPLVSRECIERKKIAFRGRGGLAHKHRALSESLFCGPGGVGSDLVTPMRQWMFG